MGQTNPRHNSKFRTMGLHVDATSSWSVGPHLRRQDSSRYGYHSQRAGVDPHTLGSSFRKFI